jgi:hypothetical protein
LNQLGKQRRLSDVHGIKIEINHLICLSDLVPYDYRLFDNDTKSLKKSITKTVEEIPHKEWIKTLNKYIERLLKCVDVEGYTWKI